MEMPQNPPKILSAPPKSQRKTKPNGINPKLPLRKPTLAPTKPQDFPPNPPNIFPQNPLGASRRFLTKTVRIHPKTHHGRDDAGHHDGVPSGAVGHPAAVQDVEAGLQHPRVELGGPRNQGCPKIPIIHPKIPTIPSPKSPQSAPKSNSSFGVLPISVMALGTPDHFLKVARHDFGDILRYFRYFLFFRILRFRISQNFGVLPAHFGVQFHILGSHLQLNGSLVPSRFPPGFFGVVPIFGEDSPGFGALHFWGPPHFWGTCP